LGLLERHGVWVEPSAEVSEGRFVPVHLLDDALDDEHMFEYSGRAGGVNQKGEEIKDEQPRRHSARV
jgi:hypothetical protein